jgi:16S rRNA (cytidine1402-2'-O)-methyltransferase
MGTLSVVATPIGNLGDITLRALETLKACDAIACEDTRVTAKLLARFGIEKPLMIYSAPRTGSESKILAMLAEGKHIALVTDAGTPGVSDPGHELVAHARVDEHRVEVIPGPSALASALSIAGLPVSGFVFLGFPPNKKGRQTFFKNLATEKRVTIFYESPHRIEKALAALAEYVPERRVVLCRELTKIHEEVVSGTAAQLLELIAADENHARGEFVVIVE